MISLPLSLAAAVVLTQLLGAEDYGRYVFAISLATLLSLPVGQGVTQLLTREIAQGMEEGRLGVHGGILSWAWRRLAIYSLAVMVLVGAAWGLFKIGGLPWFAASCLAPLVAGYQIYGGAIRGHGAPIQSQIPEMMVRPLGVLLFVAVLWGVAEVTLVSALTLHVAATVFGLWISWSMFRRLSPREVRSADPVHDEKAWRKSSVSYIALTASTFMGTEIGILALGLLDQPAQVSGMRIAQSGAQLVMLSLIAVNIVTQSKISVLARNGGGPPLWSSYVSSARLAFAGAIVVAAALILWREPLVRIAFGEEFVPLAVLPLTIMAVSGTISAFFGPSSMLLSMAGQEALTLRAQLTGLVVTFVGVFALAVPFGAAGAASAIAAGMILRILVEAIYVKRHFGVWLHTLSRRR